MSEQNTSLINNFDATQHEESAGFEALPAGLYKVMIESSEVKNSKKTPGAKFEQLNYVVIEGPMQGRSLWHICNLGHPNPTTVKIAQSEVTSIIVACLGQKVAIRSVSEIFNIPHFIDVAVEPRKDKPGDYSNRIKKWLHISKATEAGAVAGPPQANAGGATPAAAAAPSLPPPAQNGQRNGWMNKKPNPA
jgi:hypothetical protein